MSTLAQSWKAVVAFLAPGLLLLLEPLTIGDGELQGYDVRRALVVAVVTSAVVWLKRNGVSNDPTTSTPEVDAGESGLDLLFRVCALVIVVALVIYVLRLLL